MLWCSDDVHTSCFVLKRIRWYPQCIRYMGLFQVRLKTKLFAEICRESLSPGWISNEEGDGVYTMRIIINEKMRTQSLTKQVSAQRGHNRKIMEDPENSRGARMEKWSISKEKRIKYSIHTWMATRRKTFLKKWFKTRKHRHDICKFMLYSFHT